MCLPSLEQVALEASDVDRSDTNTQLLGAIPATMNEGDDLAQLWIGFVLFRICSRIRGGNIGDEVG